MYVLTVHYPDERRPRATHTARAAGEVFGLILRLRGEHGGCERIEVAMGDQKLFAVDCADKTLP